MPKSKKKKPGNGRKKQFKQIFCVSDLVLIFLLWILSSFFQATGVEIIVFYLVGSLAVIIVLRAIDRRATQQALQ
ncbi:MAG: hypothetical protein ACFFDQ_13610 [Candidatus Thorarchaeota archaeon]